MVSKPKSDKQMREFNTFGPVNPQRHYHVDRVAVKAALRVKIEKGRYLTLNAGRQILHYLIKEILLIGYGISASN